MVGMRTRMPPFGRSPCEKAREERRDGLESIGAVSPKSPTGDSKPGYERKTSGTTRSALSKAPSMKPDHSAVCSPAKWTRPSGGAISPM